MAAEIWAETGSSPEAEDREQSSTSSPTLEPIWSIDSPTDTQQEPHLAVPTMLTAAVAGSSRMDRRCLQRTGDLTVSSVGRSVNPAEMLHQRALRPSRHSPKHKAPVLIPGPADQQQPVSRKHRMWTANGVVDRDPMPLPSLLLLLLLLGGHGLSSLGALIAVSLFRERQDRSRTDELEESVQDVLDDLDRILERGQERGHGGRRAYEVGVGGPGARRWAERGRELDRTRARTRP
jgi:hypothetical protein